MSYSRPASSVLLPAWEWSGLRRPVMLAAALGLLLPIVHAAEERLSFELLNLSSNVVAARVASLETKQFEPSTDLVTAARIVSVKVDQQSTEQAAATLREALRAQVGIVLDEQPHGTLRPRVVDNRSTLPTLHPAAPLSPPDQPIGNLFLTSASVSEALDLLRQITGWQIDAPADVLAAGAKISFVRRDPIPAREAADALRETLIAQAGILLENQPGGKLSARLLPKPMPVFTAP
jgi:hypothetical protein